MIFFITLTKHKSLFICKRNIILVDCNNQRILMHRCMVSIIQVCTIGVSNYNMQLTSIVCSLEVITALCIYVVGILFELILNTKLKGISKCIPFVDQFFFRNFCLINSQSSHACIRATVELFCYKESLLQIPTIHGKLGKSN